MCPYVCKTVENYNLTQSIINEKVQKKSIKCNIKICNHFHLGNKTKAIKILFLPIYLNIQYKLRDAGCCSYSLYHATKNLVGRKLSKKKIYRLLIFCCFHDLEYNTTYEQGAGIAQLSARRLRAG
jgi:hypothetical protein